MAKYRGEFEERYKQRHDALLARVAQDKRSFHCSDPEYRASQEAISHTNADTDLKESYEALLDFNSIHQSCLDMRRVLSHQFPSQSCLDMRRVQSALLKNGYGPQMAATDSKLVEPIPCTDSVFEEGVKVPTTTYLENKALDLDFCLNVVPETYRTKALTDVFFGVVPGANPAGGAAPAVKVE